MHKTDNTQTMRTDLQLIKVIRPKGHAKKRGFSLMELLTVIAIVAILAAIIFPVFASVKEKQRQATMLSNYKSISAALTRYEMDNGKAPEVLFSYVQTDSLGKVLPMEQATGAVTATSTTGPQGLYPTYIKDVSVFMDPNNPDDNHSDVTPVLKVNQLNSAGVLAPPPPPTPPTMFYVADAADISPQILTYPSHTDASLPKPFVYVPRYQRAWTDVSTQAQSNLVALKAGADYQRQLVFWKTAPGNTYVTCSTYHVPKGKVLVLRAGGNADVVDAATFTRFDNYNDPADIDLVTTNGANASKAQFWRNP